MARLALTFALVWLGVLLAGCSDDPSADGGPCTALAVDLLDANALYTQAGEPVVVTRLDLVGTCAGSGQETFVIYRPAGLEITTDPTPIDTTMVPESMPSESIYLYRTLGVSIDIRRGATEITLAFADGSALPPAVLCRNVDGLMSCDPV